MAKKKSLKNFFNKQDPKIKDSTSVEDDNLLKNILVEFDSPSTSSIAPLVAPLPMKSLRKQATDKEVEMKRYMDKIGKKALETKTKNDTKSDVSPANSLCLYKLILFLLSRTFLIIC